MFRPDVIEVPPEHPIYRWVCIVDGCQRPGSGSGDLCGEHEIQWGRERARGVGKAAFLSAATGLPRFVRVEDTPCRICPDRPIAQSELLLCRSHQMRWFRYQQSVGEAAQFDEWLTSRARCPAGPAVVAVSEQRARAVGCARHDARYDRDGCPGGAMLPVRWWNRYERIGEVPIDYADEQAFHRWCATTRRHRAAAGSICLLRPLVAAEIKWECSSTPPCPAATLAARVAPFAGDHLPRPGARLAGRLAARHQRLSADGRRDRQGDPTRAAAGLLHARRYP